MPPLFRKIYTCYNVNINYILGGITMLKSTLKRVEIWFNNGLFRAFPNVLGDTIYMDNKTGRMSFIFGNDHEARIILSNVNFIEIMDIKDISEAHN